MANQFQDITPPQRRSIRDIPLSAPRRVKAEVSPAPAPAPERSIDPPVVNRTVDDSAPRNDRTRRAGLWSLVLIAIIFLFFGISYLFAGADVKVTPNSQNVNVNQTIIGDPNAANGAMPYAVITLEKEGKAEAPSSGDTTGSDKASGDIIIYNNYNSQPQTLIATTRFKTPEGLIFRIDKDVTVPGQATVNGKITPGTAEATLYADAPGEEYNVGLKDFTIPGFQGTPKAQGFYARSKTPLSGGFVGTRKTVSAADLAVAKTQIESNLRAEILAQANSQKPDNFILYPNALTIIFTPLGNGTSTDKKVTVKESATAYAVVLDKNQISKYLANAFSISLASSSFSGIENLTFNFTDPKGYDPKSPNQLSFKLEGQLAVVSVVDVDKLKNDLKGISRSDLSTVLANYASIKKAEVVFKPFWRWSFPSKAASIKVETVNP